MTWEQWLHWAYFELNKSLSPRTDAEILLSKVTNKTQAQLLTFGETVLNNNQIIILKDLIDRRKKGEPIAYLTGSKEFWSLNFQVSSGVFIPRPDTECLVEKILQILSNKHLTVLDLGTGIGTIALSLASERPKWNILGIDQQKQALILATKNKLSFGLNNVNFIIGDWFKYLKKNNKFHLIVSNPPYICKNDLCLLNNDMKFESKYTLISSQNGLLDLMIICYNSINYLYPNGWLFLEHGWNQGTHVRKLLTQIGFHNIKTSLDYQNNERITYAQWIP